MNVRQVIEMLQAFDGDADVFFYNDYHQQTYYAASVEDGGKEEREEVRAVYVILK